MLFICTWRWGTKWGPEYAERLLAGIRRNLKQQCRTVLISDQADALGFDVLSPLRAVDWPLLSKRGCLVRMRMFERDWQRSIGARRGDRIVNIDIDSVVTGALDPLFDRDDEFTIMQRFNQTNKCPFNGSLWMFRAGERHDVFEDFSFENYRRLGVPFHAFPDDQGWLHYKFPDAAAWTVADGVYAFKKIGWPGNVLTGSGEVRHALPQGARLVAFPGRNPGKLLWLDWIKQHWVG